MSHPPTSLVLAAAVVLCALLPPVSAIGQSTGKREVFEGGVQGDPQFVRDFQRNRRPGPGGAALKDFDLQTRIFKHRCSYMVHSPHWARLPALIKPRLYARMEAALTGADPAYAYLPQEERRTILEILRATLTDLPADWR